MEFSKDCSKEELIQFYIQRFKEAVNKKIVEMPYNVSKVDESIYKETLVCIVPKGKLKEVTGNNSLGQVSIERREIYIAEGTRTYLLYQLFGQLLLNVHLKDWEENKEMVENAYIFESKKFKNNFLCEEKENSLKFREYLVKAYSAYVMFHIIFKKLLPYTYSAFVELGMIIDKNPPNQYKASLLDISLDLLFKKDAESMKNRSYGERIMMCELLIGKKTQELIKMKERLKI